MTDIAIRPGDPYHSNDLTGHDRFLTARYRLYSTFRGQLRHADIEHPPWPFARASAIDLRQTPFEAAGLPPPTGVPRVHYAAELAVRIGRVDLH